MNIAPVNKVGTTICSQPEKVIVNENNRNNNVQIVTNNDIINNKAADVTHLEKSSNKKQLEGTSQDNTAETGTAGHQSTLFQNKHRFCSTESGTIQILNLLHHLSDYIFFNIYKCDNQTRPTLVLADIPHRRLFSFPIHRNIAIPKEINNIPVSYIITESKKK